jgi:hypothetical protein
VVVVDGLAPVLPGGVRVLADGLAEVLGGELGDADEAGGGAVGWCDLERDGAGDTDGFLCGAGGRARSDDTRRAGSSGAAGVILLAADAGAGPPTPGAGTVAAGMLIVAAALPDGDADRGPGAGLGRPGEPSADITTAAHATAAVTAPNTTTYAGRST